MRVNGVRFSFTENGLDTIMYLLEKEEEELRKKKLTKGKLDQIDNELFLSIKSCISIILNIEKKKKKQKEKKVISETKKKKTRNRTKKQT